MASLKLMQLKLKNLIAAHEEQEAKQSKGGKK